MSMTFTLPASVGARNRIKDHMTPRSSSQSLEGDSRRIPPAVTAPKGWIRARALVSVEVMRPRR